MNNPSDHDHDETQFEGFSIEDIKKNFKALGEELQDGGTPLAEIVDEVDDEPLKRTPHFRGYIPTIKDYLERASTREECEDIIEYCLKQGEITQKEAEHLRYRLEKGGPRAFGTRRPGYYDQKL